MNTAASQARISIQETRLTRHVAERQSDMVSQPSQQRSELGMRCTALSWNGWSIGEVSNFADMHELEGTVAYREAQHEPLQSKLSTKRDQFSGLPPKG